MPEGDGRGDPQVSMQPAHVDAALSTAHSRLTYQYGPVWQGDYWTLLWEGLTGRWDSITDRNEQDDDTEQATLVTDGGEPAEGRRDNDHPLKVTSPRLQQDEFELTPSGEPGRPDARELDVDTYATKTRARGEWDEPTPAVETTATTLDGFDGDAGGEQDV